MYAIRSYYEGDEAIGNDTRGQHGRLGNHGLGQFVRWACLHELPEVVTQDFACLRVRRADFRIFFGQFGLHALGLGSLAWKHHGYGQIALQVVLSMAANS